MLVPPVHRSPLRDRDWGCRDPSGAAGAAGVNAARPPGGGAARALTAGACALAPHCARPARPRRASVGERPRARAELLPLPPPAAAAAPPPLCSPPLSPPWSEAPAGRPDGGAPPRLDGSGYGAALAYPQRHLQPLRLGESRRALRAARRSAAVGVRRVALRMRHTPSASPPGAAGVRGPGWGRSGPAVPGNGAHTPLGCGLLTAQGTGGGPGASQQARAGAGQPPPGPRGITGSWSYPAPL